MDSPDHTNPPVGKLTRSSRTKGDRQEYRRPLGAWSFIELTGGFLLLAALIIGPLIVGSYFGQWRWPLIITSSAAGILLSFSSFRRQPIHWWLLIILVYPVIQGVWMWYNAWGEFHRLPTAEIGQLPWRILEIDSQPSPSLPGTADRNEAFDRLVYIIPCLGLIWGTRQLVVSRPAWCHFIAKVLFWTGAGIALIGLIQRGTGAEGIFWNEELRFNESLLFFGTYRSPGIATCFLNISLSFGLSSLLTVLRHNRTDWGDKNNRTILHLLGTTAGVIVIISAVIVAGSKAGMALGVMTILLWTLINKRSLTSTFQQSSNLFSGNKRAERNILVITLVCILLLTLLSLSGVMSDRWQAAHDQDFSTLTGRTQANQVILKMIADDGWGAMGTGPGSFYPLFPCYTSDYGSELNGVWVYAHNDYLQTLLEWGWLGTIFLATIIGGGFLILAREVFLQREHHSKTRFIYLRGYLLAMLAFLLHAAVDFPFQIESLAVIFSVMLGVAWSVVDLRGREIRSRPKKQLT